MKEFEGKLIWKGNHAEGPSKSGGTWMRSQFVVLNEGGRYEEQGLFSCFGCLAERMRGEEAFPVGCTVRVRFELRARTYQKKDGVAQWMGDCEAYHIERIS